MKAEVPGSCVKEKDLRMCTTSSDCSGNGRCMSIGRSNERYCVPEAANEMINTNPLKTAMISSDYLKMAGGLGTNCL